MYDRKQKDRAKPKHKEPFSIKDTFHQQDAMKKKATKKAKKG